jgi:hypothetical protein
MILGWRKALCNECIPAELFSTCMKLYKSCISRCPPDMQIGLHICYGNLVGSRHFSDGSYERLAIKLFHEINVHTYSLRYDTPRADGFKKLQHLLKNKNTMLGVITNKVSAGGARGGDEGNGQNRGEGYCEKDGGVGERGIEAGRCNSSVRVCKSR